MDCQLSSLGPMVTGKFVENSEVMEFFDYEVHGELEHADHLDVCGLFIGNHHIDETEEPDLIRDLLPDG